MQQQADAAVRSAGLVPESYGSLTWEFSAGSAGFRSMHQTLGK